MLRRWLLFLIVFVVLPVGASADTLGPEALIERIQAGGLVIYCGAMRPRIAVRETETSPI